MGKKKQDSVTVEAGRIIEALQNLEEGIYRAGKVTVIVGNFAFFPPGCRPRSHKLPRPDLEEVLNRR